MSIVLAGGAGFIGSKLAAHFLESGRHVLVLDNFCRGRREYLASAGRQDLLQIEALDLADPEATCEAVKKFHALHPVDEVWHMAANSDIPAGIADARVDLNDTFMTTYSLLQTMKTLDLKRIAFASSSAVYGDHGADTVLTEATGPLQPISNYGAMKLASEAMISAAAESFLDKAWIFRFPNVVGTPATHGVILDFIRKLAQNPGELQVLGNGTQQKAYMHVQELAEAMLFIAAHAPERLGLYNIGPRDAGCTVRQIAEETVAEVSPAARIVYGTESRGWVGDVPKFLYSVEKLVALGWTPQHSSLEAVRRAIREIHSRENS